jgi:hypothetical protein
MNGKTVIAMGALSLALASCGSDPGSPTKESRPNAVEKTDRSAAPKIEVPKSAIGYVRREAPAGPPPAQAAAAAKALDEVRAEIGDEGFAKASRVLSCRSMKGPVPKDPMAEFGRRAERIRAIATEGAALDAELDRCQKERRARR